MLLHIFCCLLITSIVGILVWYFMVFKTEDQGPASCGDCFCIVGEGEVCPSQTPNSNYTAQLIDIYVQRQTIANPYDLKCDPFSNANCGTSPAQDESLLGLGDTAVCAIHVVDPAAECQESSYNLKTYASREEAEAAGGFVTHLGHCGVCSTLQDLAVYLQNPSLTTEGQFCSAKNTISIEGGAACYRNLGMTEACAKVWAEAEFHTFKDCFTECFLEDITQDEPNNGPFPECALNDCLQCDADKSAGTLAKVAGRTMRRSGLLSPVARQCNEFAFIEHQRCPQTTPL
mmetsp:Transcript_12436/g.29611  ORF Transcript_12436/g.29611 Transcript_12436/m.29611 type:complete len:288 (+) Transcript_12436:274-1137(+)